MGIKKMRTEDNSTLFEFESDVNDILAKQVVAVVVIDSDSIGINVPPVSETNVPPSAE